MELFLLVAIVGVLVVALVAGLVVGSRRSSGRGGDTQPLPEDGGGTGDART